jgi:hypothetical protein
MAALASAVLFVTGGCSSGSGVEEGTAAEATGPSTPEAVPDAVESDVIPLGTYVKTETREDLTAEGVEESVLDQTFPGIDEIRITWKLEDGRWTQFANYDGQTDEPGDLGTYTYDDDDGRWVLTSESSGCPGCVNAVEWSFAGGVLTLSDFGVEPVDEVDAFVLTVLFPGEYEKVE